MKLDEGDERKLKRIFRDLPDIFTDRKLREVHKRAAQPMVYRMHRLAPVGLTGNLADSIGIESTKEDLGGIRIGARRKGGFKGFAAHLIEFGTIDRYTKKNFAYRGRMRSTPFLEPAADQTLPQVEKNIVKEEAREVEKFLKRNV